MGWRGRCSLYGQLVDTSCRLCGRTRYIRYPPPLHHGKRFLRFAGFLITDHEFTPTERDYTDVYEYCIHCGQCARNCPAQAINPNGLRNLEKCSDYGANGVNL
ncbi:MAG: 4Fe-4S binding protein [Solobacterium sp.]|nr:4Fe-4S binding protein [Solobacterium sp.]